MKTTLKWMVLTGAALLLVGCAFADGTNWPGPAAGASSIGWYPAPDTRPTNVTLANGPANAWAAAVALDVGKLVYDVLSGVSLPAVLQALFVAYLGAKGLRNYTRLGQGWPGKILRLINLELQADPAALAGDSNLSAVSQMQKSAEKATSAAAPVVPTAAAPPVTP